MSEPSERRQGPLHSIRVILLLVGVGVLACLTGLPKTVRMITLMVLLAAATTGYFTDGWRGVVTFPIVGTGVLFAFLVAWAALAVLVQVRAQTQQIKRIHARAARLSTEELHSIVANPSDPGFGFAFAELARRGVDVRPGKECLLAMLVSEDGQERGKGLTFLHAFYPDIHFPPGSSSRDSAEVWRSRLQSLNGQLD